VCALSVQRCQLHLRYALLHIRFELIHSMSGQVCTLRRR
jgi:hypothetical protein